MISNNFYLKDEDIVIVMNKIMVMLKTDLILTRFFSDNFIYKYKNI